MAVEKPKHAAIRQEPRPTIVSIFMDSINTTISGNRVTSSSNMPNRLPNSMDIKTVTHTTGPPLSRRRRMICKIKVLMPPVFSRMLNTPLITSRNRLIMMIVTASSSTNTRTGAVITRQKDMPSISPC